MPSCGWSHDLGAALSLDHLVLVPPFAETRAALADLAQRTPRTRARPRGARTRHETARACCAPSPRAAGSYRLTRIDHQQPQQISPIRQADGRASRARPRPPGSRRGSSSSARAGTPGSDAASRPERSAGRSPRRARSGSVPATSSASGSSVRASANSVLRSAGSSRSARASASSTSGEGLMSRPCSSHVYQDTPTPASAASSSRLRPGVRRRPPSSGSPTSAGDSRARRERRNARSSSRREGEEATAMIRPRRL